MNIQGTINKTVSGLTANADKLAMIYAIIGDPIGDGRGLDGAVNFMIERISQWHIPDPAKILEMVMAYSPYKDNVKNGILLFLVGEGLKAVGQSKWGAVASKVAGGLLKGTAAAAILWLPAINPHGVPSQGGALTQSVTSYGY